MALTDEETKELAKTLAGFLIALAFAGVLAYLWAGDRLPPTAHYQPTFTDAVWFTVQTVTTTGYGSLPQTFWDNSPILKWISIILMILAVPLWTALGTLLLNLHIGSPSPPTY
jgi:hypothetical protein